jgi:hypothetical protein
MEKSFLGLGKIACKKTSIEKKNKQTKNLAFSVASQY